MRGGDIEKAAEGSKILLCVVEDILLSHLWNYINCLWLVEASAAVKIGPNCLTP